MTNEQFNSLIDKLEQNSVEILKKKAALYAKNGDVENNFRVGSEISGKTMAQTAWGYMVKHLSALRGMIDADDFSDTADLEEKCTDIINYTRWIYCLAHEKTLDKSTNLCNNAVTELDCLDCRWFELSEAAERDASGKILDNIPCKTCKNNFMPGTEEYDYAPDNWKPLEDDKEFTGCDVCKDSMKGEDEFPCNMCKHAAIQGTVEYEERVDMFSSAD